MYGASKIVSRTIMVFDILDISHLSVGYDNVLTGIVNLAESNVHFALCNHKSNGAYREMDWNKHRITGLATVSPLHDTSIATSTAQCGGWPMQTPLSALHDTYIATSAAQQCGGWPLQMPVWGTLCPALLLVPVSNSVMAVADKGPCVDLLIVAANNPLCHAAWWMLRQASCVRGRYDWEERRVSALPLGRDK